MRKNKKHFMMLLVMALLCVMMIPTNVFAASKPKAAKKQGSDILSWPTELTIDGLEKGDVIKNAKSSNPSVAAVQVHKQKKNYSLLVSTKKAGTTKITFTIQRGKKSWNYAVKYTCFKYSNPFKMLKVGTSDLTKKFAKNRFFAGNGANYTGAVQVQLKSGWKLKSIELEDYTENQENPGITKLNNGDTVESLTDRTLVVYVQHTKSGAVLGFGIPGEDTGAE